MEIVVNKNIQLKLQEEILKLQGINPASSHRIDLGIRELNESFPNHSFPLGALHEFISSKEEDEAATHGFVSGILSKLTHKSGVILWVSASRRIFPPALRSFGLEPDRFIFVDIQNDREALWAVDEALKCQALTAVFGEIHDLSFTASRRLQLAVENSRVTGFILRRHQRNLSTTACISRWKISSLPSQQVDDLPGIGYPTWRVELSRIRNGRSGSWDLIWRRGNFQLAEHRQFENSIPIIDLQQQAG